MKKWIIALACASLLSPLALVQAQVDPNADPGADVGGGGGGFDPNAGGGGAGFDPTGGFGGGGGAFDPTQGGAMDPNGGFGPGGGGPGGGRGGRGGRGGGGPGGGGFGGGGPGGGGFGGGGPGGGGGGRGGRGGTRGTRTPGGTTLDPTGAYSTNSSRYSMIQYEINSPNDEWAIIGPKVAKIEDAQSSIQVNTRSTYGMTGRTARTTTVDPTADPATDPTAVYLASLSAAQKAMMDLQEAVADPATSEAVLVQKLKLVRSTRADAKKDLEAAQKDLKAYITLRQEALLIELGLLD